MTIFNVIYVLLDEDETVLWKVMLITIMDYFIMAQFTFMSAAQFPWRSEEISYNLNWFLDQLQLAPWMMKLNLTTYIVIIYISIAIVILIIMDIFYVSYSFSRKKFTYVWPLQILRSFVGLFVTVLFLPFLEVFTTMLYCISFPDGTYRLDVFPLDMVCWTGQHIIHATLCTVISFVFMFICVIVTLVFYNNSLISNDYGAKVNSRAETFDIMVKIILAYLYTFFNYPEYQWLLLTFLFTLSYLQFRNYRYAWPYYNDTLTIFFCCCTGTFLWGNFNLLILKLIEFTDFSGGYQLYFLGLPLVIAILALTPDDKIKLLYKTINNFDSGEELALQIRYYLRLDGANKDILLQHAQSLFKSGIIKFPECILLKIQYALFLMEMMDNKPGALIQLQIASTLGPSFDDEFVIFRLKKQIEEADDGLSDINKKGLDIVAKVAYDSTLRMLEESIHKSAKLHYDFWNELAQDRPDIAKLNKIGASVNSLIKLINGKWAYVQKINPNSPKALKLYAKFLIEILNDKQKGQEYIQKAKETQGSKFNAFEEDIWDQQKLKSNDTACIILSNNKTNSAQISMANLGAAKLFGYRPGEIENHSLDKLMPKIYRQNHHKIIEDGFNDDTLQFKSQERFVFGLHSSGYIFPILIQAKAIQNIKTGAQFVALFKHDRKHSTNQAGFLLITSKKRIQAITSNVQSLLGLDNKAISYINFLKIQLDKLAPDLFSNDITKQSVIKWNQPDIDKIHREDSIISLKSLRFVTVPLLTSLHPITMSKFGEIGWFIRVQSLTMNNFGQKNTYINKNNVETEFKIRQKQPLFQFSFNLQRGKYIRELRDDSIVQPQQFNWIEKLFRMDTIGTMGQYGTMPMDDVKIEITKTHNEQAETKINKQLLEQRKKWGENINIYRLVNGKYQLKDYDEDAKKQQEIIEKEKQLKNQNNLLILDTANDPISMQRNSKAMQLALNDKSTPRAVTNLRIIMNVIMVAILAIAITEFVVNNNQFTDISENFKLIRQSYQRISEIQRISYNIRTMVCINEGIMTNYQNYTTYPDFVEFLRQDSINALDDLYNLQNNISLSVLSKQDKQNHMINDKTVNLYFQEGKQGKKKLSFTLHEAVLQISSAIFTVCHMEKSEFSDNNQDIFFITYNSYSEFLISLEKSSLYYVEDLGNRAETKRDLLLTIFVSAILIITIISILLIPIISRVDKVRVQVLSLFIDIPQNSVYELANRCEEFLIGLEKEQNENFSINEIQDSETQDTELQEQNQGQAVKQSSKIPRNTQKTNNSFYIYFGLYLGITLSYFVVMYFISIQFLDNINMETDELNVLAQAEFQFSLAQNAQREMIYNPTKPLLNQNSFVVAKDMQELIFTLQERILDSPFSRVSGGFYQQSFQRLYQKSLCKGENYDLIQFEMINEPCETLLNQAASHGLQLVLIKYFETIKDNLAEYSREKEDPTFNATLVRQKLFNNENAQRLYILQFRIIKDAYRYLVEILRQEEYNDFQSKTDLRIWLFIGFMILIILFYFAIWVPYVNTLNTQIWRTKSMLAIIPIDVIIKMPKVQQFLNSQNVQLHKKKP